MSSNHSSAGDYDSLKNSRRGRKSKDSGDIGALSGPKKKSSTDSEETRRSQTDEVDKGLSRRPRNEELPSEEAFALEPDRKNVITPKPSDIVEEPVPKDREHVKERKRKKVEDRARKDFTMLDRDSWVKRNGHYLTYIGLYTFSILVLYRPYELIPGLGFLAATAFFVAAATLFIYIPAQLSTEGTLTYLSIEVKMVILLTVIALISVAIAKSSRTAWAEFNEIFIKAVLMFIVMVNVLRTRRRLMGMVWLSMGIALVLSYMALGMYWRGELGVEGYRVGVNIGGMFGNPNDLALHLVTMVPLAVALGVASRSVLAKLCYFTMSGLFVAGIMVTYSRGGFIGLMCVAGFLIWKLSKENRLQVIAVAIVFFALFIALAPGNYGMRLLSIFDPSLDGVGSRNQRRDLLFRSILVSIRNPWGIGIGNFPIVGIRNLVSHNSYTQVSSELGLLGLAAYLVFLISPFRRLAAIERRLQDRDEGRWFYFLAIGFQASLIGFCVSSFFVSVAYNWFIYYLIAYAVAFRRIYTIEFNVAEEAGKFSLKKYIPGWQN
ncbi:MAG: hypothetical protein HKN33_06895 [Pyrinomonadaceae bacterium]|nr:hypothetical protein [Pyrinomonadaceae bacterium]